MGTFYATVTTNFSSRIVCDCNPYGVAVLHTYQLEHGTRIERAKQQQHQQQPNTLANEGMVGTAEDGHTITTTTSSSSQLQIQWIGLRPSQEVQQLNLPKSTFQQLSRLDKKRLEYFLDSDHNIGRQGWDPQQASTTRVKLSRSTETRNLSLLSTLSTMSDRKF
ncbi:hypothetical protein IV203_002391 [Nitzschia inconspicua]|uniref:Uncharacterized protein n=1 Tax=Nitzschia inconspicua TaxID=303405 RepID=A0A9K3PSH8_9STRA|nr:hypothetical protein IV203_002391 [Nitzschia inconspicua]